MADMTSQHREKGINIWENRNGIQAAFLTPELAREYGEVQSLNSISMGSNPMEPLKVNRKIVASVFGVPEMMLAMGKQVHKTHISYATSTGIHEDTDGLVTDRAGIALAVLVADCAALLLADRNHKVAAAVHAGWRGAAGGIVSATFREMITLGANPENIECYISPCISQARFEVGEEVASRFPSQFVDRSRLKPHVDLQAFLKAELIQNGVPENQIKADNRCTYKNSKSFHSYRRDGKAAGRMMAAIVLT